MATPSPRVGLRALTAHGETALVTIAAPTLDVLQTFDVLPYLAPKLAFNREALGQRAHPLFFVRREVLPLFCKRDARLGEDLARARLSDTVNQRKRIGELLVIGDGDAGYTHMNISLGGLCGAGCAY